MHRLARLLAAVSLLVTCAPKQSEETLATLRLAYDEEPPEPGDSIVLEHNLPWTMACNEQRTIVVRMRNSGGTNWGTGGYKLGAFPNLGDFSGPSFVSLPHAVPMNQDVTFQFQLRAPSSATNEASRWAMFRVVGQQFFGEVAEREIDVQCSGEDFHATVEHDTFPSTVGCGETFDVSARFSNSGTAIWHPEELVALGATDDDDPFAHSTRAPIEHAVHPGDRYTFHMTFTAPPGPANYQSDWRMVRDAGGPWFEQTLRRNIGVSCEPLHDASVVTWTMPDSISCMAHFSIQVTVHNTGTTTWASQGYELRMIPGSTPLGELVIPFPPGVAVLPEHHHTFTVVLHGPAPTGYYPIGYQLYNRHREAFFGGTVQKQLHSTCENKASVVVEESLATEVGCGRPYPVRIRMKNSGLAPWTRSGGFALGNPFGSAAFEPHTTRVELPPDVSVLTNGEHTFDFMLTAPANPGNGHLMSWRMTQPGDRDFFGQGVSKEVNVVCAQNVADLVRFDLPERMTCGDVYPGRITFKNMGSATWLRQFEYRLGAVGGSDKFGPAFVEMPGDVYIGPGETYTHAFDLVAPYEKGTFVSDWQLKQGGQSFGPVVERAVELDCPIHGAKLLSVQPPPRDSCEPEVDVLVTMRNEGLRTWGVDLGTHRDVFSLSETGPESGFAFVRQIFLPDGLRVPPGGKHTFSVRMRRTEQQHPGITNTWWRMLVNRGTGDRIDAGPGTPFGATVRVRVPRTCRN